MTRVKRFIYVFVIALFITGCAVSTNGNQPNAGLPKIPGLPNLPGITPPAGLPQLPGISNLPGLTQVPGIPSIPGLPQAPLPGTGNNQPANPGGLPEIAVKPAPQEITFQGCPPQGDGGDPAINQLKNRVDEGNYVPVSFSSVYQLTWPSGVEKRDYQEWSASDRAAIEKYQGIPISVEGYLLMARQSSPESTNCHGASPSMRDWHIWLAANPGDSRANAIIVEATPRVRPNHPGWSLKALDQLVSGKERVRISGWLFFDPEHPEELGKTRGTLWEIHPVMKIEVYQNGNWVSLDQ